MPETVLSFYDPLAALYHLIFEDWDRAIERQSRILNRLLQSELPSHALRILDCACGIGTQALGFARLGHAVVASDLSPGQVARARHEATQRGLPIEFHVSDMTSLAEIAASSFDVVAAVDNALCHLSPTQLGQAAHAIAAKLRPGGLLLASIRDYDALLLTRPTSQEPAFFGAGDDRRIVHQVWDWTSSSHYTLHLYITRLNEHTGSAHHFTSELRCIERQELSTALQAAGFGEVRWLMPAETGFYQPIVLARKL